MITLTRIKSGDKYDNHYGIFGSLVLPDAEDSRQQIFVTHEKPVIYQKQYGNNPSPYDSCVPAGIYEIRKERFLMYPRGTYCIFQPNLGVYLHKNDIVNISDQYGAIFTSTNPKEHAGPAICIGLTISKKDNNRVVSESNQAIDRFVKYLDTHPNERLITIKWA